MGRIIVLLTFAGLTAAFVIIYNTSNRPVQSATAGNSNVSSQKNTKSTTRSQLVKKQEGPVFGRVSKKRSKYPSKATSNEMEGATPTGSNRQPSDAGGDPLLTVKGDSTPVYSANSKHSKVLRRLKRGEKVSPDLEVIDSEGRWRVVKGREQEKPGFVRDDQIERPPANASSAKNKPGREQTKQL
jgi:hypothetical protein